MPEDLVLFTSDPASGTNPRSADEAAGDAGLEAVAGWFRGFKDVEAVFGRVLRQSLDEVLDGGRTARFDITDAAVGKTEKTYLGTKVEIVTRAAFELPRGREMDYSIAGNDVDAKFSLTGVWAIPTEAMGHVCLLMTADDHKGTFRVGLVRITADALNTGKNKDGKKTLNGLGRSRIVWLVRDGRLPPNQLLLEIPAPDRMAVFAHRSGQRRIIELFRRFQGRVINRETTTTVACQRDPLKRCRDARFHLAPEGVVVLGHQNDSPRVAHALGLPVPRKGEFVAVRLVEAPSRHDDRPVAMIDGRAYVVARPEEPAEPAPLIRY